MPEIDDSDYEALVSDPDAETPLVRKLRNELKASLKDRKAQEARLAELEAQAARATQLEREVAFAKAGVPSDHPVAQLLMSTYDGPPTVEAIKDAWGKLGVATPAAETLTSTTDFRDEMAAADRISQAQTGALTPDREAAFRAEMAGAKTAADTIAVLTRYGKTGSFGGDQ